MCMRNKGSWSKTSYRPCLPDWIGSVKWRVSWPSSNRHYNFSTQIYRRQNNIPLRTPSWNNPWVSLSLSGLAGHRNTHTLSPQLWTIVKSGGVQVFLFILKFPVHNGPGNAVWMYYAHFKYTCLDLTKMTSDDSSDLPVWNTRLFRNYSIRIGMFIL